MLLMSLKPGVISKDDQYVQEVFKRGDSTIGSVQVVTMAHFGVKAQFLTSGSLASLKAQLDRGIPAPVESCTMAQPLPPAVKGIGFVWLAMRIIRHSLAAATSGFMTPGGKSKTRMALI